MCYNIQHTGIKALVFQRINRLRRFKMIELIKTAEIEKATQSIYNNKGNIISQEYYYFASVNDDYRKGKTKGEYKNQQMADGSPINYDNVPMDKRVLSRLAQHFPDHEGLQNDYKVFGEFKELFEDENIQTRLDIYNKWREIYTEVRVSITGKKSSFFFVAVNIAYNHQMAYFGEYRLTKEDIAKGISYWMWHTAAGMIEEKRTIEWLQKWIKQFEGLSVIPAEGHYEKKDIDAIVIDEFKRPIIYISVKSGITMTPETIQGTWRKAYNKGGKGKTKPMLYCGYQNEDDVKPTFHIPPEWEGQIKSRMKNKIPAPRV